MKCHSNLNGKKEYATGKLLIQDKLQKCHLYLDLREVKD